MLPVSTCPLQRRQAQLQHSRSICYRRLLPAGFIRASLTVTAPSALCLQGALTTRRKRPETEKFSEKKKRRSRQTKQAAGFLSINLSAVYLSAKELNVTQIHPEV